MAGNQYDNLGSSYLRQKKGGKQYKSPAPQTQNNLEDNDYSLSVSELNASLYNSSNRGNAMMMLNPNNQQ